MNSTLLHDDAMETRLGTTGAAIAVLIITLQSKLGLTIGGTDRCGARLLLNALQGDMLTHMYYCVKPCTTVTR